MERQLPYRHRQRQCPHHTHLRRHQRRPVAIHPRTERGLYDPRIRLHLQRRGQGRRQPQLPPLGAAAPAQPRRRAAQHPAQQLGRRLDERQPGGDGSDDGRLRRHGRGDVRDGRRLVRRQIPAQQRHVEPRRLGGLQGETPRGHRGADGLGQGERAQVRHLDRTRDDQLEERAFREAPRMGDPAAPPRDAQGSRRHTARARPVEPRSAGIRVRRRGQADDGAPRNRLHRPTCPATNSRISTSPTTAAWKTSSSASTPNTPAW